MKPPGGGPGDPPPEVRFTPRAPLEGVDQPAVAEVVRRAWALFGGPSGAVVEVAFLDRAEHTARHEAFLGDPDETDVMAFPYQDPDLFGEILVNRDLSRAEAARRGVSAASEALLYVAHGALHLLGFRDDQPEERRRMREAEARVLGDRLPR